MPRTIELTVPSQRAEEILERIGRIDGVISIARTRAAGVVPPGDLVSVTATNAGARSILRGVSEFSRSATSSAPGTVIAPDHARELAQESNEGLWDEMVVLLRREANPQLNFLVLMGLSGAIAAVGLWTDTLHVVIAAMVVAPGFQPLLRIPFGPIVGSTAFGLRGAVSAGLGYAVLAASAAVTLLALDLVAGERGPLDEGAWATYWSTTDASVVLLSAAAAVAGAVVVTAERAVLTAGVMIALALIPSAALTGMALVARELELAVAALGRWAVDVVLVVGLGAAVFLVKQRWLHRHRASAVAGE